MSRTLEGAIQVGIDTYPWGHRGALMMPEHLAAAVRAHLAAALDAERAQWEAIRDAEDGSGILAADTSARHHAVGALDALDCLRDALGVSEGPP